MNTDPHAKLTLPVRCGLAGRFRLQVRKASGAVRYDTGWFDNLITNQGLNQMGTGGYLTACQVGSGSTSPAFTDTALGSYVAGTSTIQSSAGSASSTTPYVIKRTNTYRFGEGAAAGNLSEVGVGTTTTTGNLFSRALITDSNGDPTTITVLANEFLDVTYQLQMIPPTGDTSVDVTDSGPAGTVHTFTIRAADVTTFASNSFSGWFISPFGSSLTSGVNDNAVDVYDGAIGAITESPSGTRGGATSASSPAYVDGSLEVDLGADFDTTAANFDISAVRFNFARSSGGSWQAGISPVIPKTNVDSLSLGFQLSWTRTTAL